MNRILIRLAKKDAKSIIDSLTTSIIPKIKKSIKTKFLSDKNLIKVRAENEDNEDFFNTITYDIENYIFNNIENIDISQAKLKIILESYTRYELKNILYDSIIKKLNFDDNIYPIINSFLYTIISADQLFKVLKNTNQLESFIIDFINASPLLNAKLKIVLIKKDIKKIKFTLAFLISNKILTPEEENCQVINEALTKQYQYPLSENLSNGFHKIKINLSINELKKFLSLIKNINININELISQRTTLVQKSIDNNTIFSPEELSADSIKVGDTITIDELFHNNTHSLNATPILYFNGNMISGNASEIRLNKDTQRIFHKQLLDTYLGNESLHTNDIIKKPINEWRHMRDYTENTLYYIFSGEYEAASIIIYKHCIIFYGLEEYISIVTNKLQSYKKPIFYMHDTGTALTKTASRLKYKKNLVLIRIF